MSGVPGSGKSTVARGLASALPAIVLDHDVTKTAILESGVPESNAGGASYEVLQALSGQILQQGYSVVIDSPCLYEQLLNFGVNTAFREEAEYRYIECVISDLNELDRRLQTRESKISQIRSLDQMVSHAGSAPRLARELIEEWRGRMQRPKGNWLLLDTTGVSPRHSIATALEYVQE